MLSRRDFLKTSAAAACLPMVKVVSTPTKVKPECPLRSGGDEKALGACATNGRLLAMCRKFERKNGVGTVAWISGIPAPKSRIVGRLRKLVAKHPRYFVEMRIYFDLDVRVGWFDRHINEFR